MAGSWVADGGVDDQVAVTDRGVLGGLFEEPEEQQAACSRGTPVEPERELIEIVLQVCRGDAALVGAQQPALQQRGHPVYTGQQRRRVGTGDYDALVGVVLGR